MSIVAPQYYHDSMCLDTYMSCDTLNTLLDMSDEDLDRRLEAIDRVITNHEYAIVKDEVGLLSGKIRDESRLNSIEVYKNLLLDLKEKSTSKAFYHPTKMNGMMTDWKKLNNVIRYNDNDLQNTIDLAFQRGLETENKGGEYNPLDYSDERITLMKDLLGKLKKKDE